MDDHTYKLRDSVDIPEGYLPGPGQLSGNGLRYYLSLTKDDNWGIYYFERGDMKSDFKFANEVKLKLDPMFSRSQPTVSSGTGQMAFVSGDGTWEGNNLHIGQIDQIANVHIRNSYTSTSIESGLMSLYPNPTASMVNVRLAGLSINEIHVLGLKGELLLQNAIIQTGDKMRLVDQDQFVEVNFDTDLFQILIK